jgi:hypothetical protein
MITCKNKAAYAFIFAADLKRATSISKRRIKNILRAGKLQKHRCKRSTASAVLSNCKALWVLTEMEN